jgi:hypothetical protein
MITVPLLVCFGQSVMCIGVLLAVNTFLVRLCVFLAKLTMQPFMLAELMPIGLTRMVVLQVAVRVTVTVVVVRHSR